MHRIYYTEPYRLEFEATVTAVRPHERGSEVFLSASAFYPTSGGQPFDIGVLGGLDVLDVEDDDELGVGHVVAGQLEVGSVVKGAIDPVRRFDHMQQHTGQHVLSAAFEHLYSVRTESFHLGSVSSTIDLAREVTVDEITAAETEANRVVWDNRPVSIRFVSAEHAATLPLRKEAVRGGQLRLIEISGFDLSACGGTHVARTGEIGVIVVRSWQRFKGGTRLEFLCGGRALGAFRSLRDSAEAAARLVSATVPELPQAIERLQTEGKDQRKAMRELSQKLSAFEAVALVERAPIIRGVRIVIEALDVDAQSLKQLAASITAEPGRVVALFTGDSPVLAVIARSADVSLDASKILRALHEQFGGRGGGKPELAQGGGLNAPGDQVLTTSRELIERELT